MSDANGAYRRASLQGCAAILVIFGWTDLLVDAGHVGGTLVIRLVAAALLVSAAHLVPSHPRASLLLASAWGTAAIAAIAALQGGAASPNLAWLLVLPMLAPLIAPDDRTFIAWTASLCLVAMGCVQVAMHDEPSRVMAWMGSSLASGSLALFVAGRLRALQSRSSEADRLVRLAERQRVHTERLALLGQLSAGVAHEIRNPLSFVKANLGVLSREAAEDTQEIAQECLSGVGRIEAIVQDLSRFARREDEATEIVSLHSVMETSRRLVASRLREIPRVEVDIPADHRVLANEQRLVQVFGNLLVNAVDALRSRPSPMRHIRVRAHGAAGVVSIDFDDSGPGVPEELRDRIFEPFFTTKPEGQGTGLGLALCRQLVEVYGGSLTAASSDLAGARFTVTLRGGIDLPPVAVRPEEPRWTS